MSMAFAGRSTGPVEVKGLRPGTYDVVAATEDGRIGQVRGVEVRVGSRDEPLAIPVEPGAGIEVFYEGLESYCNFRIFDGDTCVAGDGLRNRTSTVITVPVGRMRVEVRMGTDAVQEQWVDTVRGGRHKAAFRFE
jgi:hypothetical protein